jgi:hypothetical protein
MNEEHLRELATTLREELPRVVPDKQVRASVEAGLNTALAQPEGEAEKALAAALRATPETTAWAAERVETDALVGLRIVNMPGVPTTPLGFHVVCPNGDYDKYLDSADEDPGRCPNDGLKLLPADD